MFRGVDEEKRIRGIAGEEGDGEDDGAKSEGWGFGARVQRAKETQSTSSHGLVDFELLVRGVTGGVQEKREGGEGFEEEEEGRRRGGRRGRRGGRDGFLFLEGNGRDEGVVFCRFREEDCKDGRFERSRRRE